MFGCITLGYSQSEADKKQRPRLPSTLPREVNDAMNEDAIDKACALAAVAATEATVLLTKERRAELRAELDEARSLREALAKVLEADSTLHPETQAALVAALVQGTEPQDAVRALM